MYNGLGGSNSSGGVDNVPQRKANSTEYLRHASKYNEAHATLNNENNTCPISCAVCPRLHNAAHKIIPKTAGTLSAQV